MTWRLPKSRGLYFKSTGDHPNKSAWVAEEAALTSVGFTQRSASELTDWNPQGPDAQANCPALHDAVRALARVVAPAWRARVQNIYAGRTRNAGIPTAMSQPGAQGGFVAIGFDFTYCLFGAVITWSHFLHDTDRAREDPSLGKHGKELRKALLAAFKRVREDGAAGIRASKIFDVASAEEGRMAAEIFLMAESWVLAHEVAHHILRHGTSRADKDAQRTVREFLDFPDIAAEMEGLPVSQETEIEADVLAYLLLCGEFVGPRHPKAESAAAASALLTLLAVGLMNDDWASGPVDTHPSTLQRMAVVARIASRRILADSILSQESDQDPVPILRDDQGTASLEERKEMVRMLATMLAYGSWASGIGINEPDGNSLGIQSVAEVAVASILLQDGVPVRIFRS